MFDYMTLPAATKKFAAKEFPSPTKVWATLNKREKAIFDAQMQDKNSAVYKAVIAGRRAHQTLEHDDAKKDAFQEALLETYNKDIGIDIDETWAKEMGLVSTKYKYKGKFDGVGIFRGQANCVGLQEDQQDQDSVWCQEVSQAVCRICNRTQRDV